MSPCSPGFFAYGTSNPQNGMPYEKACVHCCMDMWHVNSYILHLPNLCNFYPITLRDVQLHMLFNIFCVIDRQILIIVLIKCKERNSSLHMRSQLPCCDIRDTLLLFHHWYHHSYSAAKVQICKEIYDKILEYNHMGQRVVPYAYGNPMAIPYMYGTIYVYWAEHYNSMIKWWWLSTMHMIIKRQNMVAKNIQDHSNGHEICEYLQLW